MNIPTRTILTLTSFGLFPLTAATKVFEAFEGDGFGSWVEEGTAFGKAPIPGMTTGLTSELLAYSGEGLACSAHQGDAALGSLTSPEFTIAEPYIVFLIAGGNHPGKAAVQLLIDGAVAMEATGKNSLRCESVTWDVSRLKGKKAKIRLLDQVTEGWGMIAADHFIFTDYANQKFPPVTKGNKPYTSGLVATDVLPGVTIPEGVTAKIIADHKTQKVTSPTALCFDEQGNIYLSETHRFRFGVEDDRDNLYWYLDDLAAQTVADRRKLHEKWKEKKPLEKLTEKSEIVRLLQDKDGDGVCETSKVFADGFNDVLDGTAAGVFALEGTVYLASIPKIWALRDKNGDGVSDEKSVIQDGFGVRISLSGHDLNGFALGPDGMIYGTVGDRALSFTTKEGKKYHYPNEGAAFRFEPDGSHFELIHTGLRNPKELAFDEFGNPISVDNNSDQGDKARVVYIVPGGDSGWQMEHQAMHTFYKQIGLEQHPVGRWMVERMWETQNDEQPAYILPPMANLTSGPSGLTYHPGAGFLESEVGRFLICDYRGAPAGSGIYSFAVAPEGAGMKMTDSREFNWGVAATDVEYSYDGKLVVADYMGGWTSHEDGRIYSLDAGEKTYLPAAVAETKKWFAEGFAKRSPEQLVAMLGHADMRVRLRAQIELTRSKEGFAELIKALKSDKALVRRHAIWGVGIVARRGITAGPSNDGFGTLPNKDDLKKAADQLLAMAASPDLEERVQVLKMLADVPDVKSLKLPLSQWIFDESPRIRFFATLLAIKAEAGFLVPQILEMVEQNADKDPFLRHAGAYALASLVKDEQWNALRAVTNPSARLAMVVALRRQKSDLLQEFVMDENPRVADEAIRAIHDLMIESSRPAVAALLDNRDGVKRSEMMWRRLLHSAFRLGGDENAKRLLAAASDEALAVPVREEAIRLLSTWTKPFPVDQSIGFWAPLAEREAAPLKQVLTAGLPQLIKTGGPILAKALGLVEQYQLTLEGLESADLQKIVENKSLSGPARAKGVELFARAKPADAEAMLSRWATDGNATVALAALTEVVKGNPAVALAPLQSALNSKDVPLAQGAWSLLAKVPGDEAAKVIADGLTALKEAKGAKPYAIELLETAKARNEAPVKQALASWESSLSKDDPLAAWAVALQGGDAKRGEQIYLSHPAECMRCHRAGEGHEAGGEAGPNLAGVATRGDRHMLLESMIVPGAKVASGFGVVMATLSNGSSVGGILIDDAKDHLDIDVGDKISRVKRSDVKEVSAPVSAMPPMGAMLKPREARDLIEWLSTLKKATAGKKSEKKVVPVLISQTETPVEKSSAAVVATTPPIAVEVTKTEDSSATTSEPATPPAPVAETVTAEAAAPSAEVMQLGKTQYALCLACHGADGNGAPGVGPPIAGFEWVTGPVDNLIRIQLRGLMGPIQVKGTEYNLVMPPQAHQSDEQIAAVLTYIRNSFGNKASVVSVDQVKALRTEVGKAPLTAADLTPLPVVAPAKVSGDGAGTATVEPRRTLSLSERIGLPIWAVGLGLLWALLCFGAGFVKRD